MTRGQSIENAARQYALLMKEVKERGAELHYLLQQVPTGIRPRSRNELMYLHVRMICEFIAIACLVCHNTSKSMDLAKFKGKYRADYILKRLQNTSAMHYPQAVKRLEIPYGVPNLAPVVPQPLPAAKLWNMYVKSDALLHVGRAEKAIDGVYHLFDGDYLADFCSSVFAHLTVHKIHLTGTEKFLLVNMENGEGEVGYWIFDEVKGPGHNP